MGNDRRRRVIFLCLILVGIATAGAGPAAGDTTLVPAGSTWKYLDDGSDQDTLWRQPGFDDGAWLSGPAQLGYGDGDEATVVGFGPDPDDKYATTYFRHTFTLSDPASFICLRLDLLRDDGAVVYVNGTETARSNMSSGDIAYYTYASSTVSGDDEDRFFRFYLDPDAVTAGENLLAVEIHQRSATSSDISFDLELEGLTEVANPVRKAPHLIYTGVNTEMKIVWQLVCIDTCVLEWGEDLTYTGGSVETVEEGGRHRHAHTITGLNPGTLYRYRVTVNEDTLTGSFRAAPPSDATSLKFIAYGDTRTYPEDHDRVAAGIIGAYTGDDEFHTLILSMGDLVYYGDNEEDWDTQFFDPSYTNVQRMLADLPYQSCMGNHEGSGELFTENFPYPFVADRYWSFDYGPAHFVCVDQYVDYTPGSDQLAWIETDLAASDKEWKFIYLHEPGWSAGGHVNNLAVQQYIQPLCRECGVSIVFAGHNHYYARGVPGCIVHVTTGGGGAPLSAPNPNAPRIVTSTEAHHYCKVEIDGDMLLFTAVTPGDSVIDMFQRGTPTSVASSEKPSPAASPALYPASPNPLNPSTTISFFLPEAGVARLAIFDLRGRLVRTLLGGEREAGSHSLVWKGRDESGEPVSSGIYFAKLETASYRSVRKLLLIR